MKTYEYPDKGDSLTCLFISNESNEEYWADSENNILNMMIQHIRKLDKKPQFLDLGCGLGRLFSVFYPFVKSITGLEPDAERFSQAQKEATRIDIDKIKVINADISCINNEKFDAVLVSHIFQHIPFETTKSIFKKLSNIIPNGGLLFITTTFTNTNEDVFTLEYLKNNKHFSEVVSEKDFIKRFYTKDVLPVREFSANTMQKLFDTNFFEVKKTFCYHFDVSKMANLPSITYDEEMNLSGDLKNAKDVLYILRRK